MDNATETWSSLIYARYKTEIDRLVNLCRACVRNADNRVVGVVSERVNGALFQGSASLLNIGSMFGRFEDFVRSHIQSILGSVATNRTSIEEFIVYKSNEQQEPQQSQLTAETTVQGTQHMQVDEDDDDNRSIDSNQFDSVSSTLSGHSMDVDQHFNEAKKRQGLTKIFHSNI